MPREAFINRKFTANSRALIAQANSIIASYQRQGFTLTLRQLYYQFVARGLLPNKQQEYNRLGSIINDARLAGLIDWDAIEDRTRYVRDTVTWNNPAEAIDNTGRGYKEDMWENQRYRPEVWIEKDALLGVIEPCCRRYRVPYFACRGYASQSELYRAGKRFAEVLAAEQTPVVFHLGDHDPSGVDMTRDNAERLSMFAGEPIDVRRIALNMAQVRQFNPPPNPAKLTDSRIGGYARLYGRSSWELDALDPTVINQLLETNITGLVDKETWNKDQLREVSRRKLIRKVAAQWSQVERTMQ